MNTHSVPQLKEQVCDVGRRAYQRGLVAGSDGNISVRLTEKELLCTPSMLCKGQMTPGDLCVVDMQGKQLAGTRRRSSEILLHLEIMQARPDVQAVVHCHPPHATAFAVVGKSLPRAITPEAEVFLGEVPIAPYETPGAEAFAETVLPYVQQTNVCLLANHGSVTFAENLEQAYYLTEMLESYCQVLFLAKQLGTPQPLPAEKLQELQDIRARGKFLLPVPAEKET